MHSFLSRANALFAFTLSVLAAVTFTCFATTFFNEYQAPVIIDTRRPFVKNLPDYSAHREKNDLAVLNFDLQIDLSPLFNWNTKELFLYLTAEYTTKENVLNQVVLWDKIVMRGDNPVIDINSGNTEYYFWDDGSGLRGNNVTLSLSWNVVPNAGQLPLIRGSGTHSVVLPTSYQGNKMS